MIQSLDGANMFALFNQFDVLNVHDAAFFALGEGHAGAKEFNKIIYQNMRNFSIPDQIYNMLVEVAKATGNNPESEFIKSFDNSLESYQQTQIRLLR